MPCMETGPNNSKLLKALIAPARHSEGPTLYLICEREKAGGWEIYEHLPDGQCIPWPGPPLTGPQQAEAAIYGWANKLPAP